MNLGAGLGSVSSGWISDQYGRKPTLMAFATIQLVTGKKYYTIQKFKSFSVKIFS